MLAQMRPKLILLAIIAEDMFGTKNKIKIREGIRTAPNTSPLGRKLDELIRLWDLWVKDKG